MLTTPLAPEDRQSLRGYILRALYVADPNFAPESTIRKYLHTLQFLPPVEELVREINFLRDKGYLTSRQIPGTGPLGAELFEHKITAAGFQLVTGEISDPSVSVL